MITTALDIRHWRTNDLIVIRDAEIENEQRTIFAQSLTLWRIVRVGFRAGSRMRST